jgi:hypothetical protein
MFGSPVPQYKDSRGQKPVVYDQNTRHIQSTLSQQIPVRSIIVTQPYVADIVPDQQYNRGWVMRLFNRRLHYENILESPPIPVAPKSYSGLIQRAANPGTNNNRPLILVSAPGINQGY